MSGEVGEAGTLMAAEEAEGDELGDGEVVAVGGSHFVVDAAHDAGDDFEEFAGAAAVRMSANSFHG